MKFGLEQHIIDKLIAVFEQHSKVDKAIMFGSRAKGNYRTDSDIDIALKGQDLNTDDIIAMSVAFEENGITHKFDLINYDAINEPDLKDHIDRVGIELYSRWSEVKLNDICKSIISGGTPLTSIKEYYDKGTIPWIKTKEVLNNKIYDSEYKITELGLLKSSAKLLPINSIIIAMYGDGDTAGRIAMNKIPLATNQACGNLIINPEIADYQFVFYYLLNSYDELVYLKSGSGQQNLNLKTLKDFTIELPPLKEQNAIATILSSLDDKIDLLHRQNKTLEQLTEVFYRQWFAEEAKESWEGGTVLDLFKLQRGFDLPTQNRIAGKYPIVASSGINETHKEYKVKAPGVTTGRSGSLGGVFYIEDDFWPLNTSLYVSEFKRATPLFTFYFLKTLDLKSLNGGSAVPTLNRNNVHELAIDLPPRRLILEFEQIAKTYFQKIQSNQTQIRTLTQTRDTLLPKLMSGEVRVNL